MKKDKLGLPVGTTLDRFIKRNEEDFPFATGELSQLLRDVGLAAKITNREINRAGLLDVTGNIGEINVQGESQQKLDVIANIRFLRAFRNGGQACGVVSEEEEEIIQLNPNGKYVIAIDPLDGSSNIDVNVSIGTIFSVYRRITPQGEQVTNEDVLQPGIQQIAAGYVLYGSSTMMVYTTGHGVNGFTLDPTLGEFFLSHPHMTMPQDGKIYSINEGSTRSFKPAVLEYLNYCKDQGFSARYIGSLVGDFHRNLLKGGIYLYPSTAKAPNGKLRLLYECNALSMICEQAGGVATDGNMRIVEIVPSEFHQRSPFLIGSTLMVEKAMGMINKPEATKIS